MSNRANRNEQEQKVISAAFARDLPRLRELFMLVVNRTESSRPLTFYAQADAGYDKGGIDDPDAVFEVCGWELFIYESVTELLGGAADGAEVFAGFHADLSELFSAMGPENGEGPSLAFSAPVGSLDVHSIPHVSISGVYKELSIVVSVLGQPPADEPPTFQENERGEVWLIDEEETEG